MTDTPKMLKALLDSARADFAKAVARMPLRFQTRIASGQQFNAYETAENDEEDDPADWEFYLSLGPIDNAVRIMDVEGQWRAELIEAALRVAMRDRALTTTPEPTDPAGVSGVADGDLLSDLEKLRWHAESNFADNHVRIIDRAIVALRTPPALEVAKEALERVLICGNHLALMLGPHHPPYTAKPEDALEHYGGGTDRYVIWCCWRAIMHARAALRTINDTSHSEEHTR